MRAIRARSCERPSNMPQPHNPVLAGNKALVVGIANESSIAYGCASAFRKLRVRSRSELAVLFRKTSARVR